jgi:hypothetical protein
VDPDRREPGKVRMWTGGFKGARALQRRVGPTTVQVGVREFRCGSEAMRSAILESPELGYPLHGERRWPVCGAAAFDSLAPPGTPPPS